MSLGTSNRDGGKTSESGHLRSIMKGYTGEVLSGLAVSQRGAGANMSVDIAIGDVIIPRSDGTYGHPAFNDAVLNQAVTTADPSNPRRDIVVIYIDYGQAPSTGVSNNTNGVVKVKIVAGTPAGSPADPTDTAIQSSVGSGNPFSKLARLRIGAGVTSVGNSVIDNLRTMAQAIHNGGWVPLSPAWDAWTYSAWDSTNKLATITVPDSTIFTLGQKVRYWQTTGGWQYGFIVKLPSSTSIMVYQGHTGGYTLSNERIYLPSYSQEQAPDGFNRDPGVWSMIFTSNSLLAQAAPTGGAWYNIGGVSLAVPIGLWKVSFKTSIQANASATAYKTIAGALSNANNTAAYVKLTNQIGEYQTSGNDTGVPLLVEDTLAFTANTTLYGNAKVAGNTSNLYFLSDTGIQLVIKAICAYL